MARKWYLLEKSIGVTQEDLIILNRAARHLVDNYNMSPTVRNLSLVRDTYKPGMSAAEVIEAVNIIRDANKT